MTYIIHYKEKGRAWKRTSYSSPAPVTREFLVEFFGLAECEAYLIVKETDND